MSGSGARVLVVDDERAIQRALKATLEAAGYHVDVVGTCSDALAQVALKPPDLVLLDLLLPDGTGDDVAREIRTWSNVPILLVSAVGDERALVTKLCKVFGDCTPKERVELVDRLQKQRNFTYVRRQVTPDEARQIIGSYTKIAPEVIAKVTLPKWPAEVNRDSVQTLADLALEDGLLEKKADVDSLLP